MTIANYYKYAQLATSAYVSRTRTGSDQCNVRI